MPSVDPIEWADLIDFHGLTYEPPTDRLGQFLHYCGEQVDLIRTISQIQARVDEIFGQARVCQQCGAYRIPHTVFRGVGVAEIPLCRECTQISFSSLRGDVRTVVLEHIRSMPRRVESADVPPEVGVMEVETAQAGIPAARRLGAIVARLRLITSNSDKFIPAEIMDSSENMVTGDVYLNIRIRQDDLFR